ncbi:MAG: dihydrodipicolinate synthase [uncultured bacterium]|nr:MAG: dihydrodipicolinate synthase [uncultured bacterium]KKT74610.1 MAG: Dihydrodipicolinate synthase [Candidatus Peregrinibacteria bacterium GW2011_GWA2_44_7]
MASPLFRGTFTALITPFTENGIDENALRQLVDRQIQAGVEGLVPVGTTGESPTLTHEEQKRIFHIVVEEARGRVQVLAGTGSNCTAKTIEMTQAAKALSADGALIVCPYYNKPTPQGLLLHYRKIAEETQFPIVIYNIKGRTGINMNTDTLLQLAENPHIVGVKEASGDAEQIRDVLERVPEDFSVLSGDDGLTVDVLRGGGDGVISVASNILPQEVGDMVRAGLAGNFEEAERLNVYLAPLFRDLFLETNPIPVKTMAALIGLCKPLYRLPLCPPLPETEDQLNQCLQRYFN